MCCPYIDGCAYSCSGSSSFTFASSARTHENTCTISRRTAGLITQIDVFLWPTAPRVFVICVRRIPAGAVGRLHSPRALGLSASGRTPGSGRLRFGASSEDRQLDCGRASQAGNKASTKLVPSSCIKRKPHDNAVLLIIRTIQGPPVPLKRVNWAFLLPLKKKNGCTAFISVSDHAEPAEEITKEAWFLNIAMALDHCFIRKEILLLSIHSVVQAPARPTLRLGGCKSQISRTRRERIRLLTELLGGWPQL